MKSTMTFDRRITFSSSFYSEQYSWRCPITRSCFPSSNRQTIRSFSGKQRLHIPWHEVISVKIRPPLWFFIQLAEYGTRIKKIYFSASSVTIHFPTDQERGLFYVVYACLDREMHVLYRVGKLVLFFFSIGLNVNVLCTMYIYISLSLSLSLLFSLLFSLLLFFHSLFSVLIERSSCGSSVLFSAVLRLFPLSSTPSTPFLSFPFLPSSLFLLPPSPTTTTTITTTMHTPRHEEESSRRRTPRTHKLQTAVDEKRKANKRGASIRETTRTKL